MVARGNKSDTGNQSENKPLHMYLIQEGPA